MRKFELEYKEETGCNVGVYCKDNVWYFNQHYVEWLEAQIEALSQHDVIKNEVAVCSCLQCNRTISDLSKASHGWLCDDC